MSVCSIICLGKRRVLHNEWSVIMTDSSNLKGELLLEELRKIGIVPVIEIEDPDKAVNLAKALIDGGINCAEVTFRTAGAAQAIKNMTEAYPDMLVGAGTVLTKEQADRAIEAGAKFIVAPGLNPDTVQYCMDKKVPMVPGVVTPSEIELALSLGLTFVKFFPAEAAGGLKMIKAVSAPYKAVSFMPTGGININNICDYLSFDRIVACGGTWIVPKTALKEDNYEEITRLCKEAKEHIAEVRG